jgi:hypothetical protein
MASDSRLSLNNQTPGPQGAVLHLCVGQSDSNYKTFLTPTQVGISTCGVADIRGVPIAGFIESFIHDVVIPGNLAVDDVARQILPYFRNFQPIPNIKFHVAGYKPLDHGLDQQVWTVVVAQNTCQRANTPNGQGVLWDGEIDVLSRLIQPAAQLDQNGQIVLTFPFFAIPWGFFTLQDAIDFSIFAIRSTIDSMRFQPRPKTVGGPIDVLVIKPSETFWVQRKALHGSNA